MNPIACENCRSKKCKCDRKLWVTRMPAAELHLTNTAHAVLSARHHRCHATIKRVVSEVFQPHTSLLLRSGWQTPRLHSLQHSLSSKTKT